MSSWTDERNEQLRQLHGLGLSAAQIAKALGGVTRNAVIGRAGRMKLGPIGGGRPSAPAAKRVERVVPFKPSEPKPRGVMVLPQLGTATTTEKNRLANIEARAKPAEDVLLRAKAFAPLPGVTPVPFGSPGCRWPVQGEGAAMACCGAPRGDGEESYCAAHARASRPAPESKARLDRNLKIPKARAA
jgi:GcrA cell cycle regulator